MAASFLSLKNRLSKAFATQGELISDVLASSSHIEGIDKVLDLVQISASRDGDDIKPSRHLEESVFLEEPQGQLGESVLFASVDGNFGPPVPAGRPRFDLDKTDGARVHGNDIDLAEWAVIVFFEDSVTLLLQIGGRQGFALSPNASRGEFCGWSETDRFVETDLSVFVHTSPFRVTKKRDVTPLKVFR